MLTKRCATVAEAKAALRSAAPSRPGAISGSCLPKLNPWVLIGGAASIGLLVGLAPNRAASLFRATVAGLLDAARARGS